MSTPDEVAMAALRRLDGAHEPDPSAFDRIETAMLARYDAVADQAPSGGTNPGDGDGDLIELHPTSGVAASTRSRGVGLLLAAATLLAVVAGAILLGSRSDETRTPATEPGTTVVDDGALVTEQLREFCAEYVEPLSVAVVRMGPDTVGEAPRNVLLAVEQATQGIIDLPTPVASRFAGVVDELAANAVAARREETLRSGVILPLQVARDSLYDAVEAVPESADLPECARP